MAEQPLSELVMNLISWIESLHEKNLKYEAQVETLSRDLAKMQNSNEQLEARLSAYQNGSSTSDVKTSIHLQIPPVPQEPQATPLLPPVTNPMSNHHSDQLAMHSNHVQHQHLQHQQQQHLHPHQHLQQQQQQQQPQQQPHQHHNHHQHQPPQAISSYQPILNHHPQVFAPQPTQYVWATNYPCDTSGQVPYYSDQYVGGAASAAAATAAAATAAPAFQQQ